MTLARHPEDPKPFRLALDDYRTLHMAGAFDRGPKVELIEGMILQMNPQENRHSFAKSELARRLGNKLEQLGSPLRATIEPTVALSIDSAPEPDIALTSDTPTDDYVKLETVALLVEVSSPPSATTSTAKRRSTLAAECPNIGFWRFMKRFCTATGRQSKVLIRTGMCCHLAYPSEASPFRTSGLKVTG